MWVRLEFGPFVPGFSSMHKAGSKSEPSTEKILAYNFHKGKFYKQFLQKRGILKLKGEKNKANIQIKTKKNLQNNLWERAPFSPYCRFSV